MSDPMKSCEEIMEEMMKNMQNAEYMQEVAVPGVVQSVNSKDLPK